jgi:phage terminase small subunit
MTHPTPDAPAHLTGSTALWEQVTSDWELQPEELEILRLACESLDRANSARKAIRRHGQTYESQPHGAPRPRPELAIARSEAQLAARLLKQLDLEDEPEHTNRGRVVRGTGRVARAKAPV